MTSDQRKNKRRQSHRNGTKAYWRGMAVQFEVVGVYSEENLNRMKRGLAPRRLAKIIHQRTGETIEFHAPKELHHPFNYQPDTPYEEQLVIELYPWEHAGVDDSRRFPWDFLEWRSAQ